MIDDHDDQQDAHGMAKRFGAMKQIADRAEADVIDAPTGQRKVDQQRRGRGRQQGDNPKRPPADDEPAANVYSP